MDKIVDSVLTDGQVRPGFRGIGRFRGRKDYSEDEKTVLEYFFTNTESNVYAATDNMPSELWALVMGQYARSSMTARDRLLKVFEDVHEKQEGPSIKELAQYIKSGKEMGEMLQKHLTKAGKFIDVWGVKYGHASLRDSGTIRMAFEGVSQRATKFLETAREGAYQEQSTRALPFTEENLGIPYELQGTSYEKKLLSLDNKLISLYKKIYEQLLVYLPKKFASLREEADKKIAAETGKTDVKLSDREWNSIIAAKAFDVSRYLLPQNMTTSLGMTLNTRRFQDMLTEWRSTHIQELQVLGAVAQAESMKISPMLMKYGEPSDYHKAVGKALVDLHKEHVAPISDFEYRHYDCESRLISAPENMQDLVLASVLLNASDGSKSMKELLGLVQGMDFKEKRSIAEKMTAKKDFEIFTKLMEIGSFIFERVYDIGAFRDLQRQRGDRQQYNRYSVIGYNMPKEVEEIGLKDEFVRLMGEVKDFYNELIQAGEYAAAEYVPVMANVIRHVVTKDPVQCFYEAKLRAQPAGIDSYRSIAQQEIHQVLEEMPVFKGLIPFDDNYYDLGRLHETVNMKIRKHKKA